MTGPDDPLRGFEQLSAAKQKLLLRRLEERRRREEAIPRSPRPSFTFLSPKRISSANTSAPAKRGQSLRIGCVRANPQAA